VGVWDHVKSDAVLSNNQLLGPSIRLFRGNAFVFGGCLLYDICVVCAGVETPAELLSLCSSFDS
jgi:hypothetical protein